MAFMWMILRVMTEAATPLGTAPFRCRPARTHPGKTAGKRQYVDDHYPTGFV